MFPGSSVLNVEGEASAPMSDNNEIDDDSNIEEYVVALPDSYRTRMFRALGSTLGRQQRLRTPTDLARLGMKMRLFWNMMRTGVLEPADEAVFATELRRLQQEKMRAIQNVYLSI